MSVELLSSLSVEERLYSFTLVLNNSSNSSFSNSIFNKALFFEASKEKNRPKELSEYSRFMARKCFVSIAISELSTSS